MKRPLMIGAGVILLTLAVLVGVLLPPLTWAEVADVSDGASSGFVDVTSSTVGVRVGPDALKSGLRLRVKAGAATDVCFNYVDRTLSCATALTNADNAGFCRKSDEAYIFLVHDEHWRGQVCAILLTGSTAVRVPFNAW